MNTIDTIREKHDINPDQLRLLLTTDNQSALQYLFAQAREVAHQTYGNKIFMRGLIEISNYCKNNCLYCGIRRSNVQTARYRLDHDAILDCCHQGYAFGFRTFVLQGGEDPWFTDERLYSIISDIHAQYPDCAITLSLGERSKDSYQRLFDAGANRYLLRHETANRSHYQYLHPQEMSYDNRMRCLQNLKDIGYQVGCGFMVGSPQQTLDTLYEDLQFIRSFCPAMVGIGPFIPATNTPFAEQVAGSVDLTIRLLAIIRLILPTVLLPATTALGTLHPKGRELGLMAGANVVMPNLSPKNFRHLYSIYDNKLSSGSEAAECVTDIRQRIDELGDEAVVDRGDQINF